MQENLEEEKKERKEEMRGRKCEKREAKEQEKMTMDYTKALINLQF